MNPCSMAHMLVIFADFFVMGYFRIGGLSGSRPGAVEARGV